MPDFGSLFPIFITEANKCAWQQQILFILVSTPAILTSTVWSLEAFPDPSSKVGKFNYLMQSLKKD